MLEIGNKIPIFSLEASTGESISSDDLKGSFVVFVFYPRNNTPG